MSEARALRVLAETARRGEALKRVDFGALCFPKQRAFVEDDSKFVAAAAGRRSGKSDAVILKANRIAQENPGCQIPYITNSRPQAKRIAWPKLQLWNRRLGLGAKFNHADLTMTLPGCGSSIMLGGANDEAEVERYRGGAYPLVIIDEAQSIRAFLRSFVIDVLLPATMDYDGQIVLIGTPNPTCSGYFYEAVSGSLLDYEGSPMFSAHHWTPFDNPNLDRGYREGKHEDEEQALARAAQIVADTTEAAGLAPTDSEYRREYLAQWVQDTEGLVYQLRSHSVIDTMPEADDWTYVLGMDVGFVDATAYVVIAYSHTLGMCVVTESFQETELLPSQQVAEADRLALRYDFSAIVVDPGGGGKGVAEELRQRHGLPAKVAQKREKIAAIGTLNGDLRAGVCKVLRGGNGELLHDLSLLQWDRNRLRRRGGSQWEMKPIGHLAIDDRTPDHLADAFLYAHRECAHHLHEWSRENPTPGSREWMDAREQELYDSIRAAAEAPEVPWWEDPPPAGGL